jgi:hypothetical protein
MDSHELPLPTFVIIGAQKSATRWLRLNLGLHPDVFSASRELEFFNNRDRFEQEGLASYRAQFEGWAGESFVGEATPGYMFWHHNPRVIAERIRETVPEVRLIAILRNPVDRAQSAVVHHIEGGSLAPGAKVLDVVRRTPPDRDPLGIVSGGWYAASLEPYQEYFGEQLLVLLHDDADDDPRGVYDQALRHVGPPADFFPPELERVRFSYQQRTSAEGPQLTLDERRELYDFFADDIRKLEKMTGRDLSLWEPDAW